MILYTLFAIDKESYSGQNGPQVLLCWDEYSVEDNPEEFNEQVKTWLKKQDQFQGMRLVRITVPEEKILDLLVSTPTVGGKLEVEHQHKDEC